MNGFRIWFFREEYILICLKRLGWINKVFKFGFILRNLLIVVFFLNFFLYVIDFKYDEMVWKFDFV